MLVRISAFVILFVVLYININTVQCGRHRNRDRGRISATYRRPPYSQYHHWGHHPRRTSWSHINHHPLYTFRSPHPCTLNTTSHRSGCKSTERLRTTGLFPRRSRHRHHSARVASHNYTRDSAPLYIPSGTHGHVNKPEYGSPPPYAIHQPSSSHGVTIINNNINYHTSWPPHYFSPPVYTVHDTGNTILGFYLGYSLGRISTPTYYYHTIYDHGYTPRYDHYSIHHYYHNRESVPEKAAIERNAVVACVGDSGSFCPTNTTNLCTNTGAVMCVVSSVSTVPCSNEKETKCVKSTIPCKDNDALECNGLSKQAAAIRIPCMQTAIVYGDVNYVNNSIAISSNEEHENVPVETESTTLENTPPVKRDVKTSLNKVIANDEKDGRKRTEQTFCVIILALPAERVLTKRVNLLNAV